MRLEKKWIAFPLLLSLVLVQTVVYSAYDKDVLWSNMKEGELDQSLSRIYTSKSNQTDTDVTLTEVSHVLSDPEQRVSPLFHSPEMLKGAVEFWLRAFTVYSQDHIILLDEHHPEVVYEVLDLRGVKRARQRYKIQSALESYRRGFRELARRRSIKRRGPRALEVRSRIEAAIKASGHKHPLSDYEKNLKAQRGQRNNVVQGLLAAEPYIPKMEAVFEQMQLPKELTRITLVESAFNWEALSKVGARGVWQFMEDTGSEYLVINPKLKLDERLSPIKSTFAAARLLKWNHRYLGNWILAITAYNHGIRRLPRFKHRKDDAAEFTPADVEYKRIAKLFESSCRGRSPLGWASRNYYAEFIAMVYAEAYRERFFGNPPDRFVRPVGFIATGKKISAKELAMDHGIALTDFRQLNPDIQDLKMLLPRGYIVAMPSSQDDFSLLLPEELLQASQSKSVGTNDVDDSG